MPKAKKTTLARAPRIKRGPGRPPKRKPGRPAKVKSHPLFVGVITVTEESDGTCILHGHCNMKEIGASGRDYYRGPGGDVTNDFHAPALYGAVAKFAAELHGRDLDRILRVFNELNGEEPQP